MDAECKKLMAQCRELRKELRKKDKKLASSFITGYSTDKPEPVPVSEQ